MATRYYGTVSFRKAFATPPSVFVTIQTDNNPGAVVARVTNVSTAGFQVMLQMQESISTNVQIETLGYLAIYAPTPDSSVLANEESID